MFELRRAVPAIAFLAAFIAAACAGQTVDAEDGDDAVDPTSSLSPVSPSTCSLTANTTPSDDVAPTGCAVLERDTSSCRAERVAAGLSGAWLAFSCRVSLTVNTSVITAKTDGRPDTPSNYFPDSDPCHAAYTDKKQNPNRIATFALTLTFPRTASGSQTQLRGAVVGLALNGVAIFGNFAAPRDDIYQEAQTFDRCGGHPQERGLYHYHGEPYALTYDDGRLVGVLLDGTPVYGRRDSDGTMPTLDAVGGHIGLTAESPDTPVYHFHVNEQTSTGQRTVGERQWFLTRGAWHGTPGTCSGAGC